MFMFTSFVTLFAAASAVPYGDGYGYGAGLGGLGLGGIGSGGLGGYGVGLPLGGLALNHAAGGPLAVHTHHNVDSVNVPGGGLVHPVNVDVHASAIPINMLFRSASSPINVHQAHHGAAGSVQESASQDETHFLRHSVVKPVVQEIREIVTPFRKIHQEIQPVRESINTIVARAVNQAAVAGNGGALVGGGIGDLGGLGGFGGFGGLGGLGGIGGLAENNLIGHGALIASPIVSRKMLVGGLGY